MEDGYDSGDCPEVEVPAGALYCELPIINKKGLHARATAKFVQCASGFDADNLVYLFADIAMGNKVYHLLV